MNISESLIQALLRTDFTSFIHRSFCELNPGTRYIPGPYIDLLASRLEACRTRKCKRLIVNLPPRTLKSHAASVAFPAWLLGHDPTMQIICASYGQDLADKHARDCRNLMGSALYQGIFPGTVLSHEKQAVEDFTTTQKGYRLSTSVGGPLTGRGGDLIIVDDAMKPEDALSDLRRNEANGWFSSTLLSRLNNKRDGVIIIVMQRLHQQDLVGMLLEREPEQWDVLALPAIAVSDESYLFEDSFGQCLFKRKAGEALHPERDSVEVFRRLRESSGTYNFQSQYQQNPTPLEGGLIKTEWLQYYEVGGIRLEQFDCVIQSWDTASKCEEVNDFSVCTTWGIYLQKFYLLDVFRERCDFPTLKRAVISQFQKYYPFKVPIEDKSSGTSLIQDLVYEGVYGIEPYKPKPGSDKYMRLYQQSAKFESGRVLLPKAAPWLETYVRELTGFPGTQYADQVDSTSQALDVLGDLAPAYVEWRFYNPNRVIEYS